MQCMNPKCSQDARHLQDGTLRLVELDVPPEDRTQRSDGGFPVCSVPSRYFWLCAECCRLWTIKRWTLAGLLLESRGMAASSVVPIPSLRRPLSEAMPLRPRWQRIQSKSA